MDFGFSQQEELFRREVREFIQRELPSELRWHFKVVFAPSIFTFDGEALEFIKTMRRKVGGKGWLSLGWPEQHGGQNSPFLQNIVYEEMLYHNCPGVEPVGALFLAPALIKFGSDGQKERFLPGIAKGEVTWCELLSEPDSGSDLASLKTSATEDGDYYVINGQKTWNSGAHQADWAFILVRTDADLPKHKGLSYFLLDMKTPGITINPIRNMAGEHEFNEVFLDDVRVPKDNMVGEKNQGWSVTMATLDFERAAHMFYPAIRAYLDLISDYIKETHQDLDPVLRNRLAELLAECEMARMIHYRAIWLMERGATINHEVAIDKMYNTELAQRASDFGMQVFGNYGVLTGGSKYAYLNGLPSFYYLNTVAYPIMGGTSEIDRNVIAVRGLGLPTK
jgi:alkylation response protein AidB-like acyl-CoA dehydrogenase